MKRSTAIFILVIMAILALSIVIMAISALSSRSEADRANINIGKQVDYFEPERRVTVYNARTDKIIMYIEGYISISNNSSNELVVTAKVGNGVYKKNYVYLNDYTLYVVEDISGTHTDPYHYKVYFDIKAPDIEVK